MKNIHLKNIIYPVDIISDNLIIQSIILNKPLSPIRLQQLLYYSQVEKLILANQPLFLEDIKGWARGPVVSSQYYRFSKQSNKKVIQISSYERKVNNMQNEDIILLKRVINRYLYDTELQIELKINCEQPYINSRQGLKQFEKGNHEISYVDIINYY